jgi:hypothetical protein
MFTTAPLGSLQRLARANIESFVYWQGADSNREKPLNSEITEDVLPTCICRPLSVLNSQQLRRTNPKFQPAQTRRNSTGKSGRYPYMCVYTSRCRSQSQGIQLTTIRPLCPLQGLSQCPTRTLQVVAALVVCDKPSFLHHQGLALDGSITICGT